jgi:hypothetical protein
LDFLENVEGKEADVERQTSPKGGRHD